MQRRAVGQNKLSGIFEIPPHVLKFILVTIYIFKNITSLMLKMLIHNLFSFLIVVKNVEVKP